MLVEAFGWFWIGLGVLSGALLGVRFRDEGFLGGYGAWPRRLVRLGHIAFFGTGFLCVLLAGTLQRHELGDAWERGAAWCMVAGAVGMPVCCGIAAFRPRMVGLFVAPVVAIGFAVTATYVRLFMAALQMNSVGGGA